MNLKTIKLTTQGIHSEPGYFHARALSGLTAMPSAITEAAAHWPEENRCVAIDVQGICRTTPEDNKRLGPGWMVFSGVVNNDSLITDGQYRSVPVDGYYEINGYTVELTFDADCPPTTIDFSM